MTTQNCAECGTRAEPGQSFCDACGAVLSWSPGPRTGNAARTAGSTPPAGSASPGNPPEATPPAGVGIHTGAAATAPGEAGPSAATPDASRLPRHHRDVHEPGRANAAGGATDGWATASPGASDGRHPGETDPTVPLPTSGESAADRARSLLVPVAEPEPSHSSPAPAAAPVLPGRPDTDRPQVRVPGPQQDTGNGPPCSWCATPNRPDRHYCARCAMPLADNDERAPAPRPWWRRLAGSRRHENPWAGDRPRVRRAFDRIGTWITAAVVVTLAVLGVVYLPDGIQATRDHFAKRAMVAPDELAASRSWTGHKPQLAFDKVNNTWWGPGVTQSGEGEWIEARFDRPTRLLDVIITPGVSIRPDDLNKSALPQRIKATITTKDGKKATRHLTLDQGSGGQRRAFRVGEAVKVRFTVESAHAASSDKQVAIAEIEFFGRSNTDGS